MCDTTINGYFLYEPRAGGVVARYWHADGSFAGEELITADIAQGHRGILTRLGYLPRAANDDLDELK